MAGAHRCLNVAGPDHHRISMEIAAQTVMRTKAFMTRPCEQGGGPTFSARPPYYPVMTRREFLLSV